MRIRLDLHSVVAVLPLSILAMGIVASNLISLHVHPFRSFYNELAIAVALLAALLAFLFSTRERVYLPGILILPVSIMVMFCVQAFLLPHSGQQAILATLYLGLACFAIILGANFASNKTRREHFCTAFTVAHLFAAVISVLIQLIQVLAIDLRPFAMYMVIEGQTGVRPFANLAQPNQLALLLCFGLASLWWLNQHRKISNLWSFFLALVLIFGLTLTQSRIGWIILPIFVLFSGSGAFGKERKNIGWLLCLLGIYVLMTWNLPEISSRLGYSSGSVAERIGGRSERTVLSEQALEMIRSHPWLGVGWGKFGAHQVAIGADYSPSTYAEHSHNIVLNFAAELGLPFTVFFFGLILIWLGKLCLSKQFRQETFVGYAFFFFAAVLVHSLVEFPLWYTFVLLPTGLLFGIVHRLHWGAGREISRHYLIVVTGIALVAAAGFTYDYQRTVDGFSAFRNVTDYAKLDPRKLQKPQFTLLPDYFDYFDLMQITPTAGMAQEDIKFVEEGSRRFGFVHILNKLAEVYVLNGRPKEAERIMLTLNRLHPFYYDEYYVYWKRLADGDPRFALIFQRMPKPE